MSARKMFLRLQCHYYEHVSSKISSSNIFFQSNELIKYFPPPLREKNVNKKNQKFGYLNKFSKAISDCDKLSFLGAAFSSQISFGKQEFLTAFRIFFRANKTASTFEKSQNRRCYSIILTSTKLDNLNVFSNKEIKGSYKLSDEK